MSRIDAIYRGGVFEPLGPVDLRDEQRVDLIYEPADGKTAAAWLQQVMAMQTTIIERRGILPDSASAIAAGRLR